MQNAHHTPAQLRLRLAEFEQGRVANVMVPRAEIVGVELSTDLPTLIQLYAEESHSRLPVYRETLDDPIGLVHIKDVVGEIARGGEGLDRPLERLRRDILYVPPSMKLADLLVKMQTSRIHMALVVDEYGGTDGLVSLEDLMEEIVGDIEDEHDEEPAMVVRRGRHAWEVDARMEISDFLEKTGMDLDLGNQDVEVDTLGGVAFALAGKVPLRGEVLRHPVGADIEIMDGDARRIERLVIRRATVEAGA
ncbi:hemolysin family protein [Henriciella barbarensis]|uniref:hemolysin family protein n=1 Tax=Henriciella barbarensis TaxID=86342 RepID=UPI001F1D5241|nr:hemolysin family protein [Henriciella barbarensis]